MYKSARRIPRAASHPEGDLSMKSLKRTGFFLALFSALAVSSAAGATPSLFLDGDCNGCDGSTLFASAEDKGGFWEVTYTINTDGYNDERIGFNQIGLKVIKDWDSASLFSAPNGVGNWSDVFEAPVNANSQCSNLNGNSDKLCIFAENSLLDIRGGGDFTWVFHVVGGTIAEEWHLGAQYADAVGPARGKIISDEGVPSDGVIPEPSAALLFGVGSLLVSRRIRSRR
jgi:hypothetical protein